MPDQYFKEDNADWLIDRIDDLTPVYRYDPF